MYVWHSLYVVEQPVCMCGIAYMLWSNLYVCMCGIAYMLWSNLYVCVA